MIKFKKKKILITGGLGFIGSNLAHQLVNAEAEVTILDNNDPRNSPLFLLFCFALNKKPITNPEPRALKAFSFIFLSVYLSI